MMKKRKEIRRRRRRRSNNPTTYNRKTINLQYTHAYTMPSTRQWYDGNNEEEEKKNSVKEFL